MWSHWLHRRGKETPSAAAQDAELLPCGQCLRCVAACPTGALQYRDRVWHVDLTTCTFCRSCASVCPNHLISPVA